MSGVTVLPPLLPQPTGDYTPPFGPPPIYVMPPVWTGAPYRPRPPYGDVPLPPIPPWGREPWWFRGPVLRPDMPSIQPVPGTALPPQTTTPQPQPEPVKPAPPSQPTKPPTILPPQFTQDYTDYPRAGIER